MIIYLIIIFGALNIVIDSLLELIKNMDGNVNA